MNVTNGDCTNVVLDGQLHSRATNSLFLTDGCTKSVHPVVLMNGYNDRTVLRVLYQLPNGDRRCIEAKDFKS
jgi:hypothetical protein